MKVQQFLAHYGITENPFSPEDAQTDHIFRKFCLHATHHPAWDKILRKPRKPRDLGRVRRKGERQDGPPAADGG